MRLEGNVSKVAICKNCDGFVMAGHIDSLNKKIESEFTQFTNEGYTVKIETVEETRNRDFASYQDCSKGLCKEKTNT